jgi:hypothetical protein
MPFIWPSVVGVIVSQISRHVTQTAGALKFNLNFLGLLFAVHLQLFVLDVILCGMTNVNVSSKNFIFNFVFYS